MYWSKKPNLVPTSQANWTPSNYLISIPTQLNSEHKLLLRRQTRPFWTHFHLHLYRLNDILMVLDSSYCIFRPHLVGYKIWTWFQLGLDHLFQANYFIINYYEIILALLRNDNIKHMNVKLQPLKWVRFDSNKMCASSLPIYDMF